MRNIFTKAIISSVIIIVALPVCAQETLPARAVQFTAGYSKHGSGDMKGIVFGAGYSKYISRRALVHYNFRSTINYQKHPVIVTNNTTGTVTDASIRFTTAGVQLGADFGYSFIRNRSVDLTIALGGFGRFQSASNGSDGYSLYGPVATGQPTVLVGYDNRTPQNTIAVGAILQLQLNVGIGKNYYIGITPGFQTDTNGDAILQLPIAIGRRF